MYSKSNNFLSISTEPEQISYIFNFFITKCTKIISSYIHFKQKWFCSNDSMYYSVLEPLNIGFFTNVKNEWMYTFPINMREFRVPFCFASRNFIIVNKYFICIFFFFWTCYCFPYICWNNRSFCFTIIGDFIPSCFNIITNNSDLSLVQ